MILMIFSGLYLKIGASANNIIHPIKLSDSILYTNPSTNTEIIIQYRFALSKHKKKMQKPSQQTLLNSLIYTQINPVPYRRYQMIKYSTWRIYLYNQLQSISADRRDTKRILQKYSTQFPNLIISDDRKQFYDFIYKPTEPSTKQYKSQYRNDNISHFVCRMLYCQQESTQPVFIQMEKRILQGRLRRILRQENNSDRQNLMNIMKKMLAFFKQRDSPNFYNIPQQQWMKYKQLIIFNARFNNKNNQHARLYAKLPFMEGQAGIRRRKSYIKGGFVYVSVQAMIDTVLNGYQKYLKKTLEKIRPAVQDLIINDVENQYSSFLIGTIKQINQQGMDDTKMNGKFNLTLKNIESLNKFFPPCMLYLNQRLKIDRHLKHDGRRQLWGFFKACGMDVHDNKQYFRKHLEGKVTASQMKTHLYNIEHAYGLQGKKKAQGAWKCRNIITGTAPKKGQHHGCPFYHWRSEQLSDFLRKNYKLTQQKLKQIISQKQQKHFQVACGRLFEYSQINHYEGSMPAQITAKLGKAPFLYYQAGMELRERRIKEVEGKNGNMGKKLDDTSIQF